MPTLYVENVPEELYETLRARARERHRSMAAEVLSLLEENIPTRKELQARTNLFRRLEKMRSKNRRARSSFPSTEEMRCGDRAR